MKKIILTVLILAAGTVQSIAQKTTILKDGWQKLGESSLSLKQQIGEIPVSSNEKIKAIKLMVSENPILLDSFDIHFAQGEKQTVNYGGYDPVPLNGNGKRTVTGITIRYKSIDEGDTRARIEVLGLKSVPEKKQENKLQVKKNIMASVE